MIPQSVTKLQLTCMVLLLAICSIWTLKGIRKNLDHNDFEVIRLGAELAMERSRELYDAESRHNERHFIYPPASSVLLLPLAWISPEAGAVATAVLKGVMLPLLLLGGVRLSCRESRGWFAAAPEALAVALILFRPIDNDFGNGQINIHLALLSFGGIALLFSGSRLAQLAGATAFAFSTAIKPPSALLLGALVLHRRWSGLAMALGLLALVSFGLPRAWYGAETFHALFSSYSDETNEMLFDAKQSESISIYEAVVFCAAQLKAPKGAEEDDGKLYIRRDGERWKIKLKDPFSARTAKMIWLAIAVACALVFFAMRCVPGAARGRDPAWDIATLAVFCLLLSPLARKAHLVVLVYPVCWVVVRFFAQARATGWRTWPKSRRVECVLAAFCVAGFYLSDDLGLPIPGIPSPLRPALLVSLILLLVLLFRLDRDSSNPSSTSESHL